MTLNKGQEYIKNCAVDWFYNSPDWLFQFSGKAGTGKSITINAIVEALGLKEHEVLPMAYTGQATIVMRQKGLINAVTAHSGLFNYEQEYAIDPVTGLLMIDKQFNMPVIKDVFVPKDFSNSQIKLFIFDEGYQIPKSFLPNIKKAGIKTLVAGDSSQLPPVADKPAFLTDNNVYYLDEIMRQSETSPIIYIAQSILNGLNIDNGWYQYGDEAVYVCYDDEFDDRYLYGASIILCGTNYTKEMINKKYRKMFLGIEDPLPKFGERVICKKNNWTISIDGIALANGLVGTVMNQPSVDKFDGDTFSMDFQADLLSKPYTNLRCNYEYIKSSYENKKIIKNSKYAPGNKFDFAYASTVHSAQGSEYPYGIYFEENLMDSDRRSLNYTAVTRFTKGLIYIRKRPRQYYIF